MGLFGCVLLGACGTSSDPPSTVGAAVIATQPSGNRFLDGTFDATTSPLRFSGPENPAWLVVSSRDGVPVIVVVDDSGSLSAFEIDEDDSVQMELNLDALPPGTPPTLLQGAGGLLVLSPPSTSGSFLTHPLPLPSGGLAFVDVDGALVLSVAAGNRRFEIDALPDARPVLSSDQLLAVYAGPTDSYAHGVLGDQLEASRIDVVDSASLEVVRSIDAPPGEVFEGLSPFWADVDGDGVDELVATSSGPDVGARIVVYSETGTVVASSEPVGRGFRWRHQLAAGPFGPNGEVEIVNVVTPHIGGRLEFLRLVGAQMESTVAAGEYSTHVLGSRNLDQGLGIRVGAGTGVIVPSQDQRSLMLATRSSDGVSVIQLVDLSSRLATNVTGTVVAGRAVLAAALADGTVLVWR